MQQIGRRIRALRLLRDYTQEHLADSLGIGQSAYCKIERGQTDIRVSQLRQIAAILGVCVTEFFKENNKDADNQLVKWGGVNVG
ncbi:helix-turn-helix transcriptional regulator [Runella sp.]|uniref:helix-turn-helix transcriptional regulator n=2 Tax=Runella sp. TaxID=1960881 RepID=UPI003015B28E